MDAKESLKILTIIPSGFCYGVQISTVDFFSRFPPIVESHFLLTRFGNGDMEKLLNKYHIPSSYSWLGMFSRKMDWYNLKMSIHAFIKLPRLYYDFIRLLQKLKPDILYFANHHELILLYPMLLLTRRKVVCHMHDPAPAIPFQKLSFKFYGSRVNRFIAITDNVRERTIALGCPPAKVQTIRMATSIRDEIKGERLNDFCQKAGWPNNVFIIGITGQMTITKGITDVIEAFRLVYKKNNNARLVIGGKPIHPDYDEIQNKIKESGLEKFIYLPGWLPDVTYFFRNLDVYVLASRHEEGFGMVVAEAMVASVPVVITPSGGATELVEDGKSGFIVEKSNPVQMSERLFELSISPETRQAFKIAARSRVMQYFDIEKQSRALLNYLYEVKES